MGNGNGSSASNERTSVVARLILTAMVLGASWLVHVLYSPVAVLLSAQNAGRQFEESDGAYLQVNYLFKKGKLE